MIVVGHQPQTGSVRHSLVSIAWLFLCAVVSAQNAKPLALVPNEHTPPNIHDVYLNDSFEAADAFREAEALSRRGRWSDAAETLQRTVDTFGNHLVRVAPGAYMSVLAHVHQTIAAWPQLGVTAYQNRYDSVFERERNRLPVLRPIEDELRLFDRYFCTTGAARLANDIAQRAVEAGDLALARDVLRRVLDSHPTPGHVASRYAAMITIINTIDGTRARGSPIPATQQDVRVRWMGQDRTAKEIVSEVERGFSQFREPPLDNDWPMFGGNPERNRVARTSVDELGLLWRVDVDHLTDGAVQEESHSTDGEDSRTRADDLTMQPVVAHGLVIVQRLREVFAIHENTGEIAWRFQAEFTNPGDSLYMDDQPPGWDAVTVSNGRVYAAIPGDSAPYYNYDSSRTPHELVCLDAETGSVIWRSHQNQADDRFSEIHFDSAPLLYQDSLFVVGRRSRSFGFEDCYLYRFDAATGSLDYRTHLGSASTGGFGTRPATRAVIAMHDGTVFINTNLGSIAAVSAHTGLVRWLRLHRRGGFRSGGGSDDLPPWRINPQIVAHERVITLPNRGPNILLHVAVSGELEQEIPLNEFGNLETILGVHDNLLCGAGVQIGCYDLDTAEFRWVKPLPSDAALFGRGEWVDDRLIAPTRTGLSMYRVSDGSRTDIRWDADAEGGNILALPEHLIVAGARTISAYVRKTEIWQALRDRMAASPNDLLPALELAELALRSGERDDALDALREAVRRATHAPELPDAPASARMFRAACAFAENFDRHHALTADELEELFSVAVRFPISAQEHLDYRVRFARLFETHDRPERALELYHQLLRDRSLRRLTVDASTAKGMNAASFAKMRIAALLADRGRELYATYEAKAKRLVAGATAAEDSTALRRAVNLYPNSNAAADALLAMGQIATDHGRHTEAAHVWSQAYHRYAGQVDRPQLMRRIADAYEKAGRPDDAYLWLTKAAREFPHVKVRVSGKMVTMVRYRDRLAHIRDQIEPHRAKLTLPLAEQYERTFTGSLRLLQPRFSEDPRQRWSRCFLHTDDGILAINPTTSADLWPQACRVKSKPDLLIAMRDVVVFATAYEIFAVDTATGKRIWSFGQYPADFDKNIVDWEDGRILRHHALHGRRLLSVRDDGEVSCIDIIDGRKLWSRVLDPVPNRTLRIFDDVVVYGRLRDGHAVLYLIDPATGESRDVIETEIEESPERVFITIDGQLVVVTGRTISAYDVETHQRRWAVSFRGQLRLASLRLDLDAVYVSYDGSKIQKLAMDDGRILWESDALTEHGGSEPDVQREGAFLFVSTDRSIHAVDPLTGLTLWTGISSDRPHFIARLVTEFYVVAVDQPQDVLTHKVVAYFYDHRNASGIIPEAGAPNLGDIKNIRTVMACDGALVIQAESSLLGITSGAKPVP